MRHRRIRATAVIVVVLVVVFVVLQKWTTSDYAITPGQATPVAPLVKIDGVKTNPHHDTIMLADVYLQSLTAWQWLTFHFQSHVQFVPGYELTDPGVSDSELLAQGFLEMRDSKQAAEVTAFRTLGWTVPSTPKGTIVNAVVDASPASRAGLTVGDDVVAVNGTPIKNSCALVRYVHDLAPGTALKFGVDKVSISKIGTLSWRSTSYLKVVTSKTPSAAARSSCSGATTPAKSWVGIALENDVAYALPAKVSINTANIGGPSAGLAMTLTLINKLSHGSLTGHHVIAVTGTMSVNGDVGPVGGVEEKAVAVHRAGSSVFIVPIGDGNVAAARDAHQPGLKILGVTTLGQVLRDLRTFGGVSPRPISKPF
jgi:PDZ domain-containing protein